MEIEAKRRQHDKRNAQRQRDKQRMEEAMKELHELKEKLRKEQALCKHEKEVQKGQTQQGVQHAKVDEKCAHTSSRLIQVAGTKKTR